MGLEAKARVLTVVLLVFFYHANLMSPMGPMPRPYLQCWSLLL